MKPINLKITNYKSFEKGPFNVVSFQIGNSIFRGFEKDGNIISFALESYKFYIGDTVKVIAAQNDDFNDGEGIIVEIDEFNQMLKVTDKSGEFAYVRFEQAHN